MGTKPGGERTHHKDKKPTFLLELPLVVEAGQAARLRAHLEAGRQFYNAVLCAGQHRLRQMRFDQAWHEASLSVFCQELAPDEKEVRRIQRKMDRQRRAANPDNYDSMGCIKKYSGKTGGKGKVVWKSSKTYQKTRRRKAAKERKMAAHRKSLHGRLVHEMVAVGNTIILEKISYKAWQKQYGTSVGLRAPGMFIELLRRTVASTGGTLIEVSTRTTKLSQYCHGCGHCLKKPLSQRWHQCACGIGPVQRDLYSAFLAAYLDPAEPTPSCAQYVIGWEGAEARLRAAHERTKERANAGQVLPQSFGIPRAGARLSESLSEVTQELLFLSRGKRRSVEAPLRTPRA